MLPRAGVRERQHEEEKAGTPKLILDRDTGISADSYPARTPFGTRRSGTASTGVMPSA
jgi:hypothetical protein